MPAFAPVKSYEPQSRWISETIGDESRFGMVDIAGVPRRGGISYYTGTAVDLIDGPDETRLYLEKYPKTIVLVRLNQFERDFVGSMPNSHLRKLRELRFGSHVYVVLAPELAAK